MSGFKLTGKVVVPLLEYQALWKDAQRAKELDKRVQELEEQVAQMKVSKKSATANQEGEGVPAADILPDYGELPPDPEVPAPQVRIEQQVTAPLDPLNNAVISPVQPVKPAGEPEFAEPASKRERPWYWLGDD